MKVFFIVIGIVSLSLGILGIVLPVLPTTPFLLLSAALFARSSDRLYCWLIHHRVFGEYVRSFREEKAIPLKIKIISVSMLWTVMLVSIFTAAEGRLWLQLLLGGIAVAVTIHILSFKTKL